MVRKMAIAGGICLIAVAFVCRIPHADSGQPVPVAAPAVRLAQATPGHEAPATSRAPASVPAPVPSTSIAEAKIRRALDSPIALDVDSESLADFARRLAGTLQIEIVLDSRRLEADGATQRQVSLHVAGVSAKAALEIALEPLELDWAVHHEVLWITTAEAAGNLIVTKVYPITDLVAGSSPDSAAPARSQQRMIDLITSSIAPGTWDEVGGRGSICEYDVGGTFALVISQSRRVHDSIADLLAQLRAVAKPEATEPETPPAVRPRNSEEALPSAAPAPKSPRARSSGDVPDSIVNANNRFACRLFDQVARQADPDKPRNMIISPYGVWSCMGLVYRGARGETAAEIARSLSFTGPAEETMIREAALRQRLIAASQGSVTLRIAERLWMHRGGRREKPATAAGASFPIAEVDFSRPPLACREINQWTSQATGGKIAELVRPDALGDRAQFLVASALYFHAPWQTPFQATATESATFRAFDREVDVPIMQLTADCGYAGVEDLQVLEKTYAGGNLSMAILLPRPGLAQFQRLEADLTDESVAGWIAKMRQETVTVRLPRFKIAFDANLRAPLENLGVARAFDADNADLSGIRAGGERLYISDVFHKACIDVNEEGTEAAAATATIGVGAMEPVKMFDADRPFLFLIRHRPTGAILFLGRVTDPSAA